MSKKGRGDTLVEVLLAIGIAGFGIGFTYATAQRSINQTITSRERNEALNLIQNQITDLRLAFLTNPSTFDANFGYSPSHPDFCIYNMALTPNDGPNGPPSYTAPLARKTDTPAGPYNKNCTYNKTGDGVTYYIDIQASRLTGQSVHPTLYQVFARWDRIGGGPINQASTYFRADGF